MPAILGGGPNMRANWLSLYRQRDMLTDVVARNLAGPDVTVLVGLFEIVLLIVSIVFCDSLDQ